MNLVKPAAEVLAAYAVPTPRIVLLPVFAERCLGPGLKTLKYPTCNQDVGIAGHLGLVSTYSSSVHKRVDFSFLEKLKLTNFKQIYTIKYKYVFIVHNWYH